MMFPIWDGAVRQSAGGASSDEYRMSKNDQTSHKKNRPIKRRILERPCRSPSSSDICISLKTHFVEGDTSGNVWSVRYEINLVFLQDKIGLPWEIKRKKKEMRRGMELILFQGLEWNSFHGVWLCNPLNPLGYGWGAATSCKINVRNAAIKWKHRFIYSTSWMCLLTRSSSASEMPTNAEAFKWNRDLQPAVFGKVRLDLNTLFKQFHGCLAPHNTWKVLQ